VNKILYDVALTSGPDYRLIGERLNVSSDFISRVEHAYDKNSIRITFEILAQWYDTAKEKPGVFELFETLRALHPSLCKTTGEYRCHSSIYTE